MDERSSEPAKLLPAEDIQAAGGGLAVAYGAAMLQGVPNGFLRDRKPFPALAGFQAAVAGEASHDDPSDRPATFCGAGFVGL